MEKVTQSKQGDVLKNKDGTIICWKEGAGRELYHGDNIEIQQCFPDQKLESMGWTFHRHDLQQTQREWADWLLSNNIQAYYNGIIPECSERGVKKPTDLHLLNEKTIHEIADKLSMKEADRELFARAAQGQHPEIVASTDDECTDDDLSTCLNYDKYPKGDGGEMKSDENYGQQNPPKSQGFHTKTNTKSEAVFRQGGRPSTLLDNTIGSADDPSLAELPCVPRRAFVLGNSCYIYFKPLQGVRKDVQLINDALHQVGFNRGNDGVTIIEQNLTLKDFWSIFRKFTRDIQAGEDFLFYYCGHGVIVGRQTYLVPVDAPRRKASEDIQKYVDTYLISLLEIRLFLLRKKTGLRLKMFIIDACSQDIETAMCSKIDDKRATRLLEARLSLLRITQADAKGWLENPTLGIGERATERTIGSAPAVLPTDDALPGCGPMEQSRIAAASTLSLPFSATVLSDQQFSATSNDLPPISNVSSSWSIIPTISSLPTSSGDVEMEPVSSREDSTTINDEMTLNKRKEALNTYILKAAAADTTAEETAGGGGKFTTAFINHHNREGINLSNLAAAIRDDVTQEPRATQRGTWIQIPTCTHTLSKDLLQWSFHSETST